MSAVVVRLSLVAMQYVLLLVALLINVSVATAEGLLPRCDTALEISPYPEFPNSDPPESGVYAVVTSSLHKAEIITVDPPVFWSCEFRPQTHPFVARNRGDDALHVRVQLAGSGFLSLAELPEISRVGVSQ